MKTKFPFFFLLILIGCSPDLVEEIQPTTTDNAEVETPESLTTLNVEVAEGYFEDPLSFFDVSEFHWLLLSDDKGEIFAQTMITNGTVTTLEFPPIVQYQLTLVSVFNEASDAPPGRSQSRFFVTINDFSSPDLYLFNAERTKYQYLTNRISFVQSPNAPAFKWRASSNLSTENTTVRSFNKVLLEKENSGIFVVSEHAQFTKYLYHFFPDNRPGGTLRAESENMIVAPVDSFRVPSSIAGASLSIAGIRAGDSPERGYVIQQNETEGNKNIRARYPQNVFEKFVTRVSYYQRDKWHLHTQIGEPLRTHYPPPFIFQPANTSLTQFEMFNIDPFATHLGKWAYHFEDDDGLFIYSDWEVIGELEKPLRLPVISDSLVTELQMRRLDVSQFTLKKFHQKTFYDQRAYQANQEIRYLNGWVWDRDFTRQVNGIENGWFSVKTREYR
ncbi:MAG: hypothetical protein AB8G22_24645 [Saprospiraceae bacterium]